MPLCLHTHLICIYCTRYHLLYLAYAALYHHSFIYPYFFGIVRIQQSKLINVFVSVGYQFQGIVDCEYDDTTDNMIYFVKNIFNQKLTVYDSRAQKYVGFGEFGIRNADHYNSQAWKMAIRKAEVETICRYSARFFKLSTLERIVPPIVKVRLTKPSSYGELSMLECSVLGFYPQEVRVTVTSTDTLANGDWSYPLHSYLEFRPQRGESVSCMVEHPSLDEPLEVVWGERPGEEGVLWSGVRAGGRGGNVGERGTERGKNILLIAVFS
uniref:Ig-like domain-containing protein n=1 Tax=Oncorhynchus tshawytscha TaxID=74940 RepID=A0A8C8CUK5_ONCTS